MEKEEARSGLYYPYTEDPNYLRVAPFKRLKNFLTEGDEVEIDERIEDKLDLLLGNSKKKRKFDFSISEIITRINSLILFIQLKLFPNPNNNKYYKRKK